MHKLFVIFTAALLTACAHVSPLVNEADMSKAIKISTKSEFALFGVAYATQIQKVFDIQGNIIIDDPVALATKSAILPADKYEVVLRCDSSSFFMFRRYELNAEEGNEYVLQRVEENVSDDAVIKLVQRKPISGV
ncbi:hypothetical protein LJ739_11295 [Aestuariibacter halophilus]|uniref:Lipoprotein n=1 Tax=Fluctibacter halophilus TaxID=226011 RepID=A0ABS8G8C8_9ALTE|nr:hypothetical protein [Aestuariibacter halophilus]MCC2616827.1 hypothetical protein [Aestuariibacter halophilus]